MPETKVFCFFDSFDLLHSCAVKTHLFYIHSPSVVSSKIEIYVHTSLTLSVLSFCTFFAAAARCLMSGGHNHRRCRRHCSSCFNVSFHGLTWSTSWRSLRRSSNKSIWDVYEYNRCWMADMLHAIHRAFAFCLPHARRIHHHPSICGSLSRFSFNFIIILAGTTTALFWLHY